MQKVDSARKSLRNPGISPDWFCTGRLRDAIDNHRPIRVSHASIRKTLGELDKAWDAFPPRDCCRLMEMLIERIDYDGVAGTIDITFHPAGLSSLGQDGHFARHISENAK